MDRKTLAGEIRTISRGLMAGGTLKSLKKAQEREINNIRSHLPPMKMPKNDKLDIVSSERDSRGINQPHEDSLVIIHWVLIDNESSVDIIYFPAFQ